VLRILSFVVSFLALSPLLYYLLSFYCVIGYFRGRHVHKAGELH